MGKTMRSVRFPEGNGRMREQKRAEVDSRWRADRDERLRRARRDEKRIERAERATGTREHDPVWTLGATVRAVA